VYFVLHASLDWLFRIPAIAIPGFVVLGALASGGTPNRLVFAGLRERVGIALATAASLGVLVPTYVSTTETNRAQDEAAISDNSALERLDRAAKLNPLSAQPLMVEALIQQQHGRNAAALDAANRAADRARHDWTAWAVLARIERSTGDPAAARAAFRRARSLNPRSHASPGPGNRRD
jgi:Flp pilus assembly protein TadD